MVISFPEFVCVRDFMLNFEILEYIAAINVFLILVELYWPVQMNKFLKKTEKNIRNPKARRYMRPSFSSASSSLMKLIRNISDVVNPIAQHSPMNE
jgi:hypothetical protein